MRISAKSPVFILVVIPDVTVLHLSLISLHACVPVIPLRFSAATTLSFLGRMDELERAAFFAGFGVGGIYSKRILFIPRTLFSTAARAITYACFSEMGL